MILTRLKIWGLWCRPLLQLPPEYDRFLRLIILAVFPAFFASFPVQAEQIFSLGLGTIEGGDER